jgi:hypothetical protein
VHQVGFSLQIKCDCLQCKHKLMWDLRFLQYTPPGGLPEDGGSRFTEMSLLIFNYMSGHPTTFLL